MRFESPWRLTLLTVGLILGCREEPAAPAHREPRWKLEDFGGVLSVGLEGYRDFEAGRRLFEQRRCAACHAFSGHPPPTAQKAPPLGAKALQYTPEEALEHMLRGTWHTRDHAPLLDPLEQSEVLDLLAYLLSGADPQSPFFQKAD